MKKALCHDIIVTKNIKIKNLEQKVNTLKTSEKENVAISTKDEAEPSPLSMEQLDGEADYEDEVFLTSTVYLRIEAASVLKTHP